MQSRTELLEVTVTPSLAPQCTQAASCSCLATRELPQAGGKVWRLIFNTYYIYQLPTGCMGLGDCCRAGCGHPGEKGPWEHPSSTSHPGHKWRSGTSCSQPRWTLLKLSAACAASFPVQVGSLPSNERLPFRGEKWNLVVFITDPRSDSTQEEKQQRMWLLHGFGPPEPVSRTLAEVSSMTCIDDGAMNF